MFDVMPMWTDMLGAGLVLMSVITITFEKRIVKMWPECLRTAKTVEKGAEKSDIEKADEAVKDDIIKELNEGKRENS